MLTDILIMIFLVLMSAYFSATETAFSSLNRTKIRTLAEKGNSRAKAACRLAEQYDALISTILIGNNIVNIGVASLGTVLFVRHYGDIGATLSTIVVTVAVLIFGEITPKSIAKDCAEKFAMFSAPIITLFMWILKPLSFLFSLWKKLIAKALRLENDSKMSQEELLMLVDEVQQDGSIDSSEGELLKNAIEFTEHDAEDILTHRVDLEAVPVTATKEEVADVFQKSKYSRLLVYNENIDHIIGVLHQKDFYTGRGITGKKLEDIITPAIFVMQNEKISSLLKKLQKEKSHIAVVLDEYGGTFGIVTMEDILEELVGEIWDEHDEVSEFFKKLDETTYSVDTAVDFEDFCDFFHIADNTEMVSLSGWVAERLGKVPEKNDSFTYGSVAVTIAEVDSHRTERIIVRVLPQKTQGAEENHKHSAAASA